MHQTYIKMCWTVLESIYAQIVQGTRGHTWCWISAGWFPWGVYYGCNRSMLCLPKTGTITQKPVGFSDDKVAFYLISKYSKRAITIKFLW